MIIELIILAWFSRRAYEREGRSPLASELFKRRRGEGKNGREGESRKIRKGKTKKGNGREKKRRIE